jgi:hypothetical protein
MSDFDIDKALAVRAILDKSARMQCGIKSALLAAGCHSSYAGSISFQFVTEWARVSGGLVEYRLPRASVGSVAAMVAGYYRLSVCWDYPDDVAAGVSASKLADTAAAVSALDGRWALGITSPPMRVVPVGVWRSMSADGVARLLVATSHAVRCEGIDELMRVHDERRPLSVDLDGELPLSGYFDHVAENKGE